MRDVAWRLGLTLAAFTVLTSLGLSCSSDLDNRLVERITGQTPHARIDAYMTAVASGNRQAALTIWTLPNTANTDLAARREAITDLLLTMGPQIEYRMLETEWWRTCCEPAVVQDPTEAGGASVRVTISSPNLPETVHIFDLLVPGGYWGKAMSSPVRHWTIVDVYTAEEAPLAWPRREW